MLYHLIFLMIYISNALGNHYETLGVSRFSTDYDIKKAYKKLARIWHPDKNKSPGAGERFMKINEAYEILSDDEKRKEYDAFGTVSNEPRGHDAFHRNNFWAASFFHNSDDDSRDNQYESIDYREYKMRVLPDSRADRPTLLLLVSHFCFSCHAALRLWAELGGSVRDSGIRVGVSDVMRDSRLREELKVHHVPTVVLVIDSQVRYLHSAASADSLNRDSVTEFLRQGFPRALVTHLESLEHLRAWHQGWVRDSRPRVLLVKPLSRPSIRYLSLAFRFRDSATAGFIHISDTDLYSDDHWLTPLVRAHGLRSDQETILIFHDESSVYSGVLLPKPVAQLSQTRLSLADMESLIQSHNQLPVSRLLSQAVFDRACPPPSQRQRSLGFCVISVWHSRHSSNVSNEDNWRYLRSLALGHASTNAQRPHTFYLYGDIQFAFLKSLRLFDQSPSSSEAFINQVILLWRQSYDSATSILLSNPWEYPNLDWVLTNWNLLSNLDTAIPILRTKNRVQTQFANSESLSELIDELAAPLIWRIWARFLFYCQQIFTFIYENFLDPFTLIVIVLAFIFCSYFYSAVRDMLKHIAEEDSARSKNSHSRGTGNGSEVKCSMSSLFKLGDKEITAENFDYVFKSNKLDRLAIVMFASKLTPGDSFSIITSTISKLKYESKMLPFFTHQSNLIRSVLECVSDSNDRKEALNIISSLSINRPKPEEGIVLAFNTKRKYFWICPINLLRDTPLPIPNKESTVRNRNLRNATYYLESDSSESDIEMPIGRTETVESVFFDWLSQLTEGKYKRFHVTQWPVRL